MISRLMNIILLSLIFNLGLVGQSLDISIKLIDETSGEPVSDAHIFIENSTFGTISDKAGYAVLSIPTGLNKDLLISHISYDLKIVGYNSYKEYTSADSVGLVPNLLELDALTIRGSRSKKWKKNYKKFQKAFLGADKIAKQCEILNPEVLRFEEADGYFIATAIDLVHVRNPYLAYEIYYHLNQLVISGDGSVEYLGKAQFVDMKSDLNRPLVEEHRYEVYLNSPKYFFKTLIDDKLEEARFKAKMMNYNNGEFVYLKDFVRDQVLKGPSQSNKYTVEFDEFLEVFNENSKSITFVDSGVRPGGLESSRFSAGTREEKLINNYKVSQLYKLSPYIVLNEFGNILNSHDVKEYGFWADQKIAYQLPFDYGNSYHLSSNNLSKTKVLEIDSLTDDEKYKLLISLIYERDLEEREKSIIRLIDEWEDGFTAPFIELLRMSNDDILLERVDQVLSDKYKLAADQSYYDRIQWLWSQNFPEERYYFKFKSELYKHIDSSFENYFAGKHQKADINLSEVMWGGVMQDGIPPLRNPEMLNADEADYLNGSDVVFGFYINGEPRAYPKRILAWHEFFTDDFGGLKIAGVYCTLCGTVIAYDMSYNDVYHNLGTSGFLYRSNKLMYDKATQSLWSTIDGKPVIGSLVGKGIELKTYPVVTSTWDEWKTKHPETKVLSLNTGYNRDYKEGAAYNSYFATDELMFPVISLDNRLKNKDEVVVLRVQGYKSDPLAVSVDYLRKRKWHQDIIGKHSIVMVSDKSDAIRAYSADGILFDGFRKKLLTDSNGDVWRVHEDFLESHSGKRLYRLPAHNIFWFAWFNAYPDTRLVK